MPKRAAPARLSRAWKSTWASLAVLDLVGLAILALLLHDAGPGARIDEPRMPPAPGAVENTVTPTVARPTLALPPAQPRAVYLVSSRQQAAELLAELGRGAVPRPSFEIMIVRGPGDDARLAKLLYPGTDRPAFELVDLRVR